MLYSGTKIWSSSTFFQHKKIREGEGRRVHFARAMVIKGTCYWNEDSGVWDIEFFDITMLINDTQDNKISIWKVMVRVTPGWVGVHVFQTCRVRAELELRDFYQSWVGVGNYNSMEYTIGKILSFCLRNAFLGNQVS